jgi:hypothetical protein
MVRSVGRQWKRKLAWYSRMLLRATCIGLKWVADMTVAKIVGDTSSSMEAGESYLACWTEEFSMAGGCVTSKAGNVH